MTFAGVVWYAYILTIPNGLLVPDTTAEADTAEALALAEQSGDDLALDLA
jgi:adenylate cyclase